ncbi:MAG: hypothetical protein LBT60_03380 [Oscillospiraceae bacterium]|jgi:hypothetical protein|nr:hypothetical protein [Oscillospiraceae bacterium]
MSTYEELYQAAYRQARRYVADGPEEARHLPVLSERLAGRRTAGEYVLGVFDVPLKKVVGTCLPGRSPAFAGNFMPLLKADSELAAKWMSVCRAHHEEGLRDAIQVCEYLGYYYVMEGHKRVSVLKSCEAYGVSAEITRILPAWEEQDSDVAVLYEYYQHDRRLPVTHMWFSAPGRLTALFAEEARLVEPDAPEEHLLTSRFARFRQAYHARGFTALPMTTGDAFYSYIEIFGLAGDIPPAAALRERLTACARQWRFASAPAAEGVSEEEHRAALAPGLLGLKPRPLVLAAALAAGPEEDATARAHGIALRRLALRWPELSLHIRTGLPPDDTAWPVFEELLAEEPHFLFAPAPGHGRLAWRAGLMLPDAAVVHMSPEHHPDRRLSTCWGQPWEAALLAGALAGTLTKTDRAAVLTTAPGSEIPEAWAFAWGASLTNPRADVFCCEGRDAWRGVKAAFALHEVDTAWLPPQADARMANLWFPGVYACLCALSRADASVADIWAAAAWHWSAFYMPLTEAALSAGLPSAGPFSGGAAACRRLSMAEGLIRLHLVETLLAPGTRRLTEVLRAALAHGALPPPESPPSNLTALRL